jgi:site-specific DNA-methyltransferase (adenine-specific)
MSNNIKLYNDDCMNIMPNYPDNYFDLAIVDPPYAINIAKWDNKVPSKKYFNELFRVSKHQIIFGGNYFDLPHTQSWICWDKTYNDDIKGGKLTQGGVPRENMSDFELMWTSFSHKAKMFRFTQIGNLIGFDSKIQVDYTRPKKIHPTQKDIQIYSWLYNNYAKPVDKILDTHLGSGSSAIACHYFGTQEFIGIEIDKEYFDMASKRTEEETMQGKLI